MNPITSHFLDHAPFGVLQIGSKVSKRRIAAGIVLIGALLVISHAAGSSGLIKLVGAGILGLAVYLLVTAKQVRYTGMFSDTASGADTHREEWCVSYLGWFAHVLALAASMAYLFIV